MCEVEVIQNPIIKLSLNLAEANYLQQLLRNPYIHKMEINVDEVISDEPKNQAEIRTKLYTVLKKVTQPLNPTELR